jgi:hypothetical protein
MTGGIVNLAVAKESTSIVDKHFGTIVLGVTKLPDVLALHGKGLLLEDGIVCYFERRRQQFLTLNLGPGDAIETIIVSTKGELRCKSHEIDGQQFFCSERGICLNDPMKKVIDIFGKPGKKTVKKGSTLIEYHTDSEKDSRASLYYDASYRFKNGKLIEMVIHDGE